MNRRAFIYNAICLTGGSLFRASGETARSLGTIAYLQTDGLWLRELPGGSPRLLVSGRNLAKPRFSPSGKWISYLQANKLHVLSLETGAAHVIGTAKDEDYADMQWSPQRDELALETEHGVSIFSAENQWERAIHRIAGAEFPFLFGAGGNEVVFADIFDRDEPGSSDKRRQGRICRLSLRDAKPSQQVLIAEDDNYLIPYAWNQRRGEIYCWRDPDFSASVRCDGLALAAVSDKGGPARALGVRSLVYDDMLAVSPGTDNLLVCDDDGGYRNTWERKRIALVNLQTQEIRYLTDKSTSAVTPCWSPEGDRVVFAAAPSGDTSGGEEARLLMAHRRLWIAGLKPGSAPRPLTHDPRYRDEEPVWSADGTHILFGRIKADGHRSLWMMTASGASPHPVTEALPINDGHEGVPRDRDESWWGYYGYIDWRQAFDWRQSA